MLDPKFIRENPELIREAARKKHIPFDVDRFLVVDKERRSFMPRVEDLTAAQRKAGKEMGQASPEAREGLLDTPKRAARADLQEIGAAEIGPTETRHTTAASSALSATALESSWSWLRASDATAARSQPSSPDRRLRPPTTAWMRLLCDLRDLCVSSLTSSVGNLLARRAKARRLRSQWVRGAGHNALGRALLGRLPPE